jgi:hypothetical protein
MTTTAEKIAKMAESHLGKLFISWKEVSPFSVITLFWTTINESVNEANTYQRLVWHIYCITTA